MTNILNLQSLFDKSRNSGVYFIDRPVPIDDLRQQATETQFRVFYLDGNTVRNKLDFISQVNKLMEFPTFENNWNAFLDCLRDLMWFSSGGYILIFDAFHHFAMNDREEFDKALKFMGYAAEFFSERMNNNPPLYILLHGDKTFLQDVESL